MTEAEVRALIAQVIEEFLARQRAKRVLVLWAGALLGCGEAWEAMMRLRRLGLHLNYIQTPSAERLLDQEKVRAVGTPAPKGHLVLEHDLLVIPTLTANLTSKVACGVADCFGSNVIADFIQTGKTVIASRTPVDPAGEAKRSIYPDMPQGYAAVLSRNLATLASFGVTLADSAELDQAVLAQRWPGEQCAPGAPAPAGPPVPVAPAPAGSPVRLAQRLISLTTVGMCPDGTVLKITPTAIVTAEAQDFARYHNIQLIREA
jgi:hypothetical protein